MSLVGHRLVYEASHNRSRNRSIPSARGIPHIQDQSFCRFEAVECAVKGCNQVRIAQRIV